MHNETLFFTVVYPQALPFFVEVCNCARAQTLQSFDFLIVNDGCDMESLNATLKGLNATVINAVGSIAGNRIQGIEYARKEQYKYLFFCDADDTFTNDRHERTINEFELSGADIVVCNLNVANEKCEPVIRDYFSLEIPSDRWIDAEFLKNKNIMGMSNTAIRVSSIPNAISIPDISIADWYLFSVLLLSGLSARFITYSMVNYRQYNANMIGIIHFDVPSFRKMANHKLTHYKMLCENGFAQFQEQYEKCKGLTQLTDDGIMSIIERKLALHKQPLWWQIIEK